MAKIIGTPGDDSITPDGVSSGVRGGVPSNTADRIYGLAGDDTINGGGGDDRLDGGTDLNFLQGGPGNDTLTGSVRGDRTSDNNYADYSDASGSVTATISSRAFATGDRSVGTDRLLHIDTLIGTSGDDHVTVAQSWRGSQYNEGTYFEVMGEAGVDTIIGNGNTRTSYYTSPEGVVVDFAAGTAKDGFGSTDMLGNGVNQVQGSAYNDTLLGSGTLWESFRGADGNDYINGRGGQDRADYLSSPSRVHVDLGAGTADDGFGNRDRLVNMEEVRGSRHDDCLKGSGGDNNFDGWIGADRLIGGAGNDTFDYNEVRDSTPGVANRDIILDFSGAGRRGGDRIDLSTIDANATKAGDQPFTFKGTAAIDGPGQVRVTALGKDTLIQANIDGSNTPDMEILVKDGGSTPGDWIAADFIL